MCNRSRASTSSSTPSGPSDVKRADPTLVVGGDRDGREHALDLVVGEALRGETLARAPGDQLLRARTGGHALGLDAGQGAGAALGHHGGAAQRVDLLGGQAGRGGRHGLRVAGGDRHLGAKAALLLADLLRDPRRELLGAEGLAQHDLVDRLVDDLLEARHVHPRLVRVEVHGALELGEEVAAGRVGGGAVAVGRRSLRGRRPESPSRSPGRRPSSG